MVANVTVTVEIGSQTDFVEQLFPIPVSVAVILAFGSLPTSSNVGNVGHYRKCGVKVGIAAPSLTIQKLFLFPFWWRASEFW